ncbi:MAG: site-specific integrase [Nanoarchaeota archaeon]
MPSQPITEFQFEKLLEETRNEKNLEVSRRDILFYKLLYFLGLRPSEARLIKILEIDINENKIFIPAENNKEKQSGNIFIPDFLMRDIFNFILFRKIKSVWLFPSLMKTSSPICYKQCEMNLKNRLKKLGLLHQSFTDGSGRPRYQLNLYSFRKRFGTSAYLKLGNCPIKTAKLLRHEDPQLKSVWMYIKFATDAKSLMQELYS